MNISEFNLNPMDMDSFVNKLNELELADSDESVLFTSFTDRHMIQWPKFDPVVIFNIYHTYMEDGTILFIRHPETPNLKNLYINVLNSLFEEKFGIFGPLNGNYYKLHINGKAIAIAYHDSDAKTDSSLIFIPKKELLADYHLKYNNADDVMDILAEL